MAMYLFTYDVRTHPDKKKEFKMASHYKYKNQSQ